MADISVINRTNNLIDMLLNAQMDTKDDDRCGGILSIEMYNNMGYVHCDHMYFLENFDSFKAVELDPSDGSETYKLIHREYSTEYFTILTEITLSELSDINPHYYHHVLGALRRSSISWKGGSL